MTTSNWLSSITTIITTTIDGTARLESLWFHRDGTTITTTIVTFTAATIIITSIAATIEQNDRKGP